MVVTPTDSASAHDDSLELDEAQGYAALMELQPQTYTVETIATKVGRSEAYVYARLRLLHLIPEARQAFYEAKLTVAHAFEMARLQPNDQQRALQECFPQHCSAAAILKDRKAESVTVRELRQWIEREIHLDLTNAPFDPQDETLLLSAGACARWLRTEPVDSGPTRWNQPVITQSHPLLGN